MKKYFTKKSIYIGLFAILYLIVAFSSFWHACAFFGLANNSWMSIILAFAFEVGQAAVLFSLLTSAKDRSRTMPWVLMTMFTLVQVIGNVFSSYKYLITNSVENLRYFKEPIFIWTDLPDDQTTVIITYIVGAILPICALLLTSMITNYLTDNEEEKKSVNLEIKQEKGPQNPPIILNDKEDFDEVYNNEDTGSDGPDKVNIDNNEDTGSDGPDKVNINNEIEELKESYDKLLDEKSEVKKKLEDALDKTDDLNKSLNEKNEEIENLKKELEDVKNNVSNNEDTGSDGPDKINIDNIKKENNSHFINLN